jgi:site-specific DNA recombinase
VAWGLNRLMPKWRGPMNPDAGALRSREGRPARHLFTALLKCDRCNSNFVRINRRDYRCATYTNGGKHACGNALKLNAPVAEQLLLDQIETELLSPEAVEAAVAAYNDEAKRQRRERPAKQPQGAIAAAVAKKDAEIEQLKQMIRAGTMSATVLQPAIEGAERERERLLAQVEVRQDADVAKVARMLPNAVGAYRGMVRQLRDARELLTDGEYLETRALVFEMLGGRVPVKAQNDGSASLTMNMTLEPILKACGSMSYNLVAGAGFEPATFGL